jgi:hypothetical protein
MRNLIISISFITIVLSTACTSGTPQATVERDWTAVAEVMAPGNDVDEVARIFEQQNADAADASWFDVCRDKYCDETELAYSRLFRNAALTSAGVRELGQYVESRYGRALSVEEEDRLARLRDRLNELRSELRHMSNALDTARDYRGGTRDRTALMQGIAHASEQVSFSIRMLDATERMFVDMLGPYTDEAPVLFNDQHPVATIVTTEI